MQEHLKYLVCDQCLAMHNVERLAVAITPEGHLLVRCMAEPHGEYTVAFIENGQIGEVLRSIADEPCACCGSCEKETVH
jgi:hypothetical protein